MISASASPMNSMSRWSSAAIGRRRLDVVVRSVEDFEPEVGHRLQTRELRVRDDAVTHALRAGHDDDGSSVGHVVLLGFVLGQTASAGEPSRRSATLRGRYLKGVLSRSESSSVTPIPGASGARM